MKERLSLLIDYAIQQGASDIHFVLVDHQLQLSLRIGHHMEAIQQDLWDEGFFHFLLFEAGFDLTNLMRPQSHQFRWVHQNESIYCRLSVIVNRQSQTAVLRLLNQHHQLSLDQLTTQKHQQQALRYLANARHGLIVCCGPTGAGKTTMAHALLAEMKGRKIVTLEDPIEIENEQLVQYQVNAQQGLDYAQGIEQLLRHDPDVILIGEIRSEQVAHMAVRAALTGHLVVTTLHAIDGLGALIRLKELGISLNDLLIVMSGLIAMRLYQGQKQKMLALEIVQKEALRELIETEHYPKYVERLPHQIQTLLNQAQIVDPQAQIDLLYWH